MNPVRELFEQYRTGGLDYIEQLIGTMETGVLDFKRLARDAAPMLDDDKQHLSKALSAFANASGGVLVWGVEAKGGNGSDKADVVVGFHPISNLTRLQTDLLTLSPQLVSRPLEGVEHCPIYTDQAKDIGYVVTYIPEGVDEPHQATASGLNRYYIRNGSVFLPMTHAMVADRFNRRVRSRLVLEAELSNTIAGKIHVSLSLRNVGLRPAKSVAIVYTGSDSVRYDDITRENVQGWFDVHFDKGRQILAGDFGLVIHPQVSVGVGQFVVPYGRTKQLVIPHQLYAEDRHEASELVISSEHLERFKELADPYIVANASLSSVI